MPPGSGRPPFPGPGAMPVASTPPQVGIPYRPAGVPPPPVMRIQPPVPSTVASSGASALQATPTGAAVCIYVLSCVCIVDITVQ